VHCFDPDQNVVQEPPSADGLQSFQLQYGLDTVLNAESGVVRQPFDWSDLAQFNNQHSSARRRQAWILHVLSVLLWPRNADVLQNSTPALSGGCVYGKPKLRKVTSWMSRALRRITDVYTKTRLTTMSFGKIVRKHTLLLHPSIYHDYPPDERRCSRSKLACSWFRIVVSTALCKYVHRVIAVVASSGGSCGSCDCRPPLVAHTSISLYKEINLLWKGFQILTKIIRNHHSLAIIRASTCLTRQHVTTRGVRYLRPHTEYISDHTEHYRSKYPAFRTRWSVAHLSQVGYWMEVLPDI